MAIRFGCRCRSSSLGFNRETVSSRSLSFYVRRQHHEHIKSISRSASCGDSHLITRGLFATQRHSSECSFRPAARKDYPAGSAFIVYLPPRLFPVARCSVGALGEFCDRGAGSYHLVCRIRCATRECPSFFSRLDGCDGRVLPRRDIGPCYSVQHHPILHIIMRSVQSFTPPNHSLASNPGGRRGCNRCVPCAGSLSLGRSAAAHTSPL
jgi:hypothetical protein